jgi:hypothetical protein
MLRNALSLYGRDARRYVVEFAEDVRLRAGARGKNAGKNDEL